MLSLAVVFAPMAFATNYDTETFVYVYGSWLKQERYVQSTGLYQVDSHMAWAHIWLLLHTFLSAMLWLGLLALTLYNPEGGQKRRFALWGMLALLLNTGLALLGMLTALSFAGEGQDMEVGIMREFFFHVFAFIFGLWAWLRIRKDAMKHPESGNSSAVAA